VTAHISGSILDYTVDVARNRVVAGSSEIPRPVDEFWTFTRPAGLNSWMLSAIQTAED
jgi:predicted lipid-binding transport protein (Tim44 family)